MTSAACFVTVSSRLRQSKASHRLPPKSMLPLTSIGTLAIVVMASSRRLQQEGILRFAARSRKGDANTFRDSTDESSQQMQDEFVDENRRGERRIQTSDPSDHYFCGVGFADASSSCAHPCPSGSASE